MKPKVKLSICDLMSKTICKYWLANRAWVLRQFRNFEIIYVTCKISKLVSWTNTMHKTHLMFLTNNYSCEVSSLGWQQRHSSLFWQFRLNWAELKKSSKIFFFLLQKQQLVRCDVQLKALGTPWTHTGDLFLGVIMQPVRQQQLLLWRLWVCCSQRLRPLVH